MARALIVGKGDNAGYKKEREKWPSASAVF